MIGVVIGANDIYASCTHAIVCCCGVGRKEIAERFFFRNVRRTDVIVKYVRGKTRAARARSVESYKNDAVRACINTNLLPRVAQCAGAG